MDYDPSKLVPENVSKSVYDGLEQIGQTGEVDMADRAAVWNAAMGMGLKDTARWLEGITTRAYEILTRMDYIVLEDQEQIADFDEIEDARSDFYGTILSLGQYAAITVADTYAAEEMGKLGSPPRRAVATHERDKLIRNLAEASTLRQRLDAKM